MQEENFQQILESNKEKIYRICKIYAISPIEPQDLFQEVAFQIWKSLSSFKKKSSINTWVYRIALNVCMRSKLKLDKNNSQKVRLESIQFSMATEETDSIAQEKYKFLMECIKGLNESDTSILVLFLEDLSYRELASISGLTENNVAVKMKRIRKRLFDCINPKLN